MRDPRKAPKVGDKIRQRGTSIHLKVVSVEADRVEWQRKTRAGWERDNAWTMKAWREIVAINAEIIKAVE